MIDGVEEGGHVDPVQLNTYADLIAMPARAPYRKKEEVDAVERGNNWKRLAIAFMLVSTVTIASTVALTAYLLTRQPVACTDCGEMEGRQVANTCALIQHVSQPWTDIEEAEEVTPTEFQPSTIAPSVTCPPQNENAMIKVRAQLHSLMGQIDSIK